jgi:hypothetical protein
MAMVLSGQAGSVGVEMPRRRYIVMVATACAIAVGAAGCGSATHHDASSHQRKHIVLTQAALGFGAFHRFIWAPARAGRFSDPGSHAVSQADEAARFTSNELRAAAHQVRANKQLRVLFAPLELTADKVSALRGTLPRHSSVAQVEAINGILQRIAAAAKENGANIADASAAEIAAAGGPRA